MSDLDEEVQRRLEEHWENERKIVIETVAQTVADRAYEILMEKLDDQ